jgi:hypothetical protein
MNGPTSLIVIVSRSKSSGSRSVVSWPLMVRVSVGVDLADDGLPVEARIRPLLHGATVEPLNTDARAG